MKNSPITYTCNKCEFSFTQADKAWDQAITSGMCPKCKFKLADLPFEPLASKVKEITETFKCDNCKKETEITNNGYIHWFIKAPLFFALRGHLNKVCKSCSLQVNLGGWLFLILFVLYIYSRIK